MKKLLSDDVGGRMAVKNDGRTSAAAKPTTLRMARVAAVALAAVFALGGLAGAWGQPVELVPGTGLSGLTPNNVTGTGVWNNSSGIFYTGSNDQGRGFLYSDEIYSGNGKYAAKIVTDNIYNDVNHLVGLAFRYSGNSSFYTVHFRTRGSGGNAFISNVYMLKNNLPSTFNVADAAIYDGTALSTTKINEIYSDDIPIDANGSFDVTVELSPTQIVVTVNTTTINILDEFTSEATNFRVGFVGYNTNIGVLPLKFTSARWEDPPGVPFPTGYSPSTHMLWNPTIGTDAWLGGEGTWSSTGDSWSDYTSVTQVPWVDGGNAVFYGAGDEVTIATTAEVSNIDFISDDYMISGGTLELVGASGSTILVAPNLTATINSVITGEVSLTKSGTGTLTLGGAGANTYTGSTTISAGTVVAAKDNALGTGEVTVATVGTLRIGGTADVTLANDVTIGASNLFSIGDGENTISGELALSGTGAHTITVDAPLTLSGGITGAVSRTITKTGTADLTLTGDAITGSRNIEISDGTLVFNHSGTSAVSYTGVISGTGDFEKTGTGTLTLDDGAITHTGSTTITAGTLEVVGGTINNVSGGGNLTKVGTGDLTLSGTAGNLGTLTVSDGVLVLGQEELEVGELNMADDATLRIPNLNATTPALTAGTATLGGTLSVAGVTTSGTYLLIAGTATGEFAAVTGIDTSKFDLEVTTTGGAVNLVVTEKFTVTFVDSTGVTTLGTVNVKDGDFVPLANVPGDTVLTGHTFVGWRYGTPVDTITTTELLAHPITEDITFTAVYDINKYTLTFEYPAGTEVGEIENIPHGTPFTAGIIVDNLPSNPCGALMYVDWGMPLNIIKNDTLVAECTAFPPRVVTFKWVTDSAGTVDTSVTVEVFEGSSLVSDQIPNPTRDVHTLKGWSHGTPPTTITTAQLLTLTITGDTTFTAEWELIKHRVTFNDHGDRLIKTVQITHGTSIPTDSIPPLTSLDPPEDHDFDSWYPPLPSIIIDSITVVAQYKQNKWPESPLKIRSITPPNAASAFPDSYIIEVEGFDSLRAAIAAHPETVEVDTVWVWYKPNDSVLTAPADIGTSGGRQLISVGMPPAGDTVRVLNARLGSNYSNVVDPYYYFYPGVAWKTEGGASAVPTFVGENIKGWFMMDPVTNIIGKNPNTLTVTAPSKNHAAGAGKKVTVNVGNLASLAPFADSVGYRPYADSLGIWYRRGTPPSYPATFTNASGSGNLSLEKFRYGSTISFEYDIPTITNANVDTLYFLVAPVWRGKGLTKDSIPAVAVGHLGHICTVYVHKEGTQFIKNPVVLSSYQGTVAGGVNSREPSVVISLSKEAGEDFDAATGSIIVEFYRTPNWSGVPDSTWTFSPSDFSSGAVSRTINNDMFVGKDSVASYIIRVTSSDPAILGDDNYGVIPFGRAAPVMPVVTGAVTTAGNQVRLTWPQVTAADGIGNLDNSWVHIYYGPGTAAPTVLPATPYQSIKTNTNPVFSTRTDLDENADYWFAVVLEDVVTTEANRKDTWNLKSEPVTLTIKTVDAKDDPNTISIVSADYVADSMMFRVVYRYGVDMPALSEVNYWVDLGEDNQLEAFKVIENGALKDAQDTLYIRSNMLKSPVMFDTSYTITVSSSVKEPDAAILVATGAFMRQIVTVPSYKDTVKVNNDKFRVFLKDPPSPNTDDSIMVVRVIREAELLGNPIGAGFVPLSPAYRCDSVAAFDKDIFDRFTIGIKADSIPAGREGDVRLYRFVGGTTGYWEVAHDTECDASGYCYGSARNVVRLDAAITYRLMINNSMPKITMATGFNSNGEPTFVGANILDTSVTYRVARRDSILSTASSFTEGVSVVSNVANARVTLYFAPAEFSEMTVIDSVVADTASSPSRNLRLTVSRRINNTGNAGMFAYLVVDNGSRRDTVNVSRRAVSSAYRGFSSPVNVQARRWRPLATEVDIVNRHVSGILSSLFVGPEEEFGRDSTKYLLYRWFENAENANSADKWVSYDPLVNGTDFTLETGRLMWLKTAGVEQFDFVDSKKGEQSMSVSLVDTFTMVLPPKQWTDFVLPFRYDISLRDVVRATGGAVDYYVWDTTTVRVDGSNTVTYTAKSLFTHGVTSGLDSVKILEGGRTPFTVYNDGAVACTLRIDPRPYFMTSAAAVNKTLAKSRSENEAWYYTIRASSDVAKALPGVMIGYSQVGRNIPVAPSFGSQSVMIIDSMGRALGHAFRSDLGKGGRVFRLRFTNGEKSKAVFTWVADAAHGVPENAQVMFVNATTGETIAEADGKRTITVGASSHEDVLMVVGSREYVSKTAVGPTHAKFQLAGISVNQMARSARIRYYIPLAGVDRVEVSVYNMKGALLFKKTDKVRPASWNTMEWRSRESRGGRVAAGLYIVRVRAINAKGKTVAVENRRFTFAR